MPNKPWLIDRSFSVVKVIQVFFWIILRILNRFINSLPVEINIKNRVINHKYFLNSNNWHSEFGDHVFGYFGNLIDKNGIKTESKHIIESRPSDFPIFFDRPMTTKGVFFMHSMNNPYNYYHFVYDFCCPLFIHRAANPDAQVFLPFYPTKWQVEWLQIIGQTNILHANVNGNFSASKIVKFEKFLDSKNQIQVVNDFLKFRNYIQTFLDQSNPEQASKKIYIVRKKSSMGRNVENQQQIISRLTELDFKIVDLDQLSVAMQLDVFHNAHLIVSPHDAGLSNLVATKTGARVLELLPTQSEGTYDMYKNICHLTKIHHTTITPTLQSIYNHGANFNIDLIELLNEIMDNPKSRFG